jgi:hypothetical protein
MPNIMVERKELFGVAGLVVLGVSCWGYYKYHRVKLSRRETDPNVKFLRSNILTTVNEAIGPWFGVIGRLKEKYPTSALVYKTKNISLHFLEFEIIDIFERTHNVKQVPTSHKVHFRKTNLKPKTKHL